MVNTPADDQIQESTPQPAEGVQETLLDLSIDSEATPEPTVGQAAPAGEGEGESTPEVVTPEPSPTENIPAIETTGTAITDALARYALPPVTTSGPTGEQQQRQRMAQLEQENQQLHALQAESIVETQRSQYQQNLEEAGHTTDAAQTIADNWSQAQKSVVQYKQQVDSQAQESQAKVQAAQMIGQQFGVDAQNLMAYGTPGAMQSAAKQLSENKGLRSRIEALEKKQVPAQKYDAGQSAGTATGRDALRDRYADGADLTEVELQTLFGN